MTSLIVCDLDGVVYLGAEAIPGAADALRRICAGGHELVFCTNNSWRTAGEVAQRITTISGFEAASSMVVTSAMVAAGLVEEGPVYVLGGAGIVEEVTRRGFEVTADAARSRTVVVGIDLDLTYDTLAGAVTAVMNGARLIATNHDATYPTERGLLPGAGSVLAAVETASGVAALVAGKPNEPMRSLLRVRAAGRNVWVVGDREDTDLEMAYAEGWSSVLVLTGVTRRPEGRPTLEVGSLIDFADHLLA